MHITILTPRVPHCLYWAALAWLAIPMYGARADTPPSSSLSNGVFLGYGNNVFLSQPRAVGDLAKIRSACARRGRLWALGNLQQINCLNATDIANTHGNVLKLQIDSPDSVGKSAHAALYSTRPFSPPSWTVRQLLESDKSALRKEIAKKYKKYSAVLSIPNFKNAIVIVPVKSLPNFYILPWKITDNGYVEKTHFIIAGVRKGQIFSVREQEGKVVGYADLDGDNIPELHLSHNCDGSCESVISMTRETKNVSIVTISGH